MTPRAGTSRRIAHISDVHFGREDPALVRALLEDVAKAAPDVVVISGDLTQRARKRQFRAARDFLKRLPPVAQIVVPGNHDVSATNLLERTLRPMLRFQKYISPDLAPFFADEELAIAGVNTVRTFKRKDGRINARQVREACAQLATAPRGALRVVVTHHPMDLVENTGGARIVRRAGMAMRAFAVAGVDLFLSGHLHVGASTLSSATYRLPGYSALVVHAGTAVSTRTREAANAWNLLRVYPLKTSNPAASNPATSDPAASNPAASNPATRDVETGGLESGGWELALEQRVWQGRSFEPAPDEIFRKGAGGWSRS